MNTIPTPAELSPSTAPRGWFVFRHKHLFSRKVRIFCLLLLFSCSFLLYHWQASQQQQIQQQNQQLRQQLWQQLQQLQTSRQQQQQLIRDLPHFQQLPFESNSRLSWLEQLSQLQQHYPLQFQLAAQQALPLPTQQLSLHFNPLQLQLNLQHEQQFLDVLNQLQRDPWFRLRQCQLQRQNNNQTPLLAHCQGGWLTLSLREPKT